MADRAKIIGPLRGSSPRQQACSGATPALRAVEPGFAFGPKKKAALNTRAASPSFSGLEADLYESADGLRPGRKIVLAATPIIDFGEHRIMPAHSDLSTGAGRLGAASWLFGNTN
jgi:hypothetical protein